MEVIVTNGVVEIQIDFPVWKSYGNAKCLLLKRMKRCSLQTKFIIC